MSPGPSQMLQMSSITWKVTTIIIFLPLTQGWAAGAAEALPLPSHILQLIWGNAGAFPGQLRDIISPACPRSATGSPPDRTCLDQLVQECLAPFSAEDSWLYSEPLLDGWALHLITPYHTEGPNHIICKKQKLDSEATKVEAFIHLAMPRNSVHKAMNRICDKGQLWQSPTPTGNESDLLPAMRTKLLQQLYMDRMAHSMSAFTHTFEASSTGHSKVHSRMTRFPTWRDALIPFHRELVYY